MSNTRITTINITPSWYAALSIIAAVLIDGTEEGRAEAKKELFKVADLLQSYVDNGDNDVVYISPAEAEWILCELQGAFGPNREVLLKCTDHFQLRSMLDANGMRDFKVINWRYLKG